MAFEIGTAHGPARVHLHAVVDPLGALVLGHGAGGGVATRDLVAATTAAVAASFTVALVEQPYRVAGRRSPAPASHLDADWKTVVAQLRSRVLAELPVVVGGRSSGARVACRTAHELDASAVLCLAYPLRPLRRAASSRATTRQSELDAVKLPTLVVQGAKDPFGMPASGPDREVAVVPGAHALTTDVEAVSNAVGDWLTRIAAPAVR